MKGTKGKSGKALRRFGGASTEAPLTSSRPPRPARLSCLGYCGRGLLRGFCPHMASCPVTALDGTDSWNGMRDSWNVPARSSQQRPQERGIRGAELVRQSSGCCVLGPASPVPTRCSEGRCCASRASLFSVGPGPPTPRGGLGAAGVSHHWFGDDGILNSGSADKYISFSAARKH